MSNSGLATVKIPSPHYSKRTESICGVAIHCMAGNLTAKACGNLFAKQSTKASSNYGIDSDGIIGLYVDESYRSWCTSSNGVDSRAITIEVANTKAKDPWPISDAAYRSLITLLVDICVRNNIKELKWSGNKSWGTSFKTSKQNVWVHRWFANKDCPGDYIYKRLPKICSTVNSNLKNMSEKEKKEIKDAAKSGKSYTMKNISTSTSYSNNVNSNSTSNSKSAPPVKRYLATIDRNTTTSNFSQFIKNSVIGVVIEAGYLYDSKHNKVDFKSPKLDAQIASASKATLPYGFYFTARATSVQDVREEVYALSFILRKYPSKLGVWLVLDLKGSVSSNDSLLDEYYNQLIKLGLVRQLGLYVTESQLKTITWNKHQTQWWLWINKHFTKSDEFKNTLSQNVFKLTASSSGGSNLNKTNSTSSKTTVKKKTTTNTTNKKTTTKKKTTKKTATKKGN